MNLSDGRESLWPRYIHIPVDISVSRISMGRSSILIESARTQLKGFSNGRGYAMYMIVRYLWRNKTR